MEIKMLENDKILITKNMENYLIEKEYISGTLIKNYFVYQNIYFQDDLESFINSSEENKYFINDFTDLESAIRYIQEEKED